MLHEIVKNYMVANEPLPSIDVVFYVTRSILNVIGHFTVSVADAWTLPIRGKLSVLIPLIITLAIHYLKQRFFVSWSKRETCFHGECTTMQSVYLSFTRTELVFCLKLLLPYLKGHSYAVLNFKAIDPERELYKRQQSIRRSRASWQSQDAKRSQLASNRSDNVFRDGASEDVENHSWELDETGFDDPFCHQVPRSAQSCHVALGKPYFECE